MKKIWLTQIIVSIALCGYTVFLSNDNFGTEYLIKSDRASFGGTLIVGVTGDVDTFNPLFNESSTSQKITHLLLLGLADLNEKSEFVPELATARMTT